MGTAAEPGAIGRDPCHLFSRSDRLPRLRFTVILSDILFWRDTEPRSASFQMALDEALFSWAAGEGVAAARFYRWSAPARTIGYFEATLAPQPAGTVRRFTGGGLVEHHDDLTFALALPPNTAPTSAPAAERYRWIHECLRRALAEAGLAVSLAVPELAMAIAEPADDSVHPGDFTRAPAEAPEIDAPPGNEGPSGRAEPIRRIPRPCFANPVPADLVDEISRAKIGGGAQRRSRGAVLHQGSLRLPANLGEIFHPWIESFLDNLAQRPRPLEDAEQSAVSARAEILHSDRYGAEAWNRPSTR